MQDQQAVSRVTREHCSSFFHFTAVLPSALLPIPTVTPWNVTPSPRYYRECGPHYCGYRGIPAVPITVQTSTGDFSATWTKEWILKSLPCNWGNMNIPLCSATRVLQTHCSCSSDQENVLQSVIGIRLTVTRSSSGQFQPRVPVTGYI